MPHMQLTTTKCLTLMLIAILLVLGCTDHTNFNVFRTAVPLERLRVRGVDGSVFWDIQSSQGRTKAYVITYGQVPPGFIQLLPKSAPPRALQRHQQITIMVLVDDTAACVHAHALDARSFAQDGYETIAIPPRSSAAAAKVERIIDCAW